MVKLLKLLVVGCEEKGRPLENLKSLNHEFRKLPDSCHQDTLYDSAKWCDLLFVGSERCRAYIIADEIWHLLRGKPVISLTDGLPIKELRDLYPLSKVARCHVYPDILTERALFLLSLDITFSQSDAASLKGLFQNLGDSLLIGEKLLEFLHSYIKRSQEVINELICLLAESAGKNCELIEYLIGWVLYGVGLATIKGEELPQQGSKNPPFNIREELRRILKPYYEQ